MLEAKEITKSNLEAELVLLQSEVDNKATELNSLVSSVDEAKALIALSKKMKADTEAFILIESNKLDKAALALDTERKEFDEYKNNAGPILNQHKKEATQAVRELNRANSSCLVAKEELSQLTEKKTSLVTEIEELTNLVMKGNPLRTEIQDLELKKLALENDIHEATAHHVVTMSEAKEQLATIRNDAQTALMQKEEAEAKLKDYTDKLYTSMNDYQVVRERIERHWNQTFPELRLPM